MNGLIQLAKTDIKDSELLLNNQRFNNSLYFYHQAVEKAVKYLGLEIGIVDETDLRRKISHNPLKVFIILNEKENLFRGEGIDSTSRIIKELTDENLVSQLLAVIEESTEVLYELDDSISYFQNFKKYITDKEFPEKESILLIEENSYYNKKAMEFFNQLNVGDLIIKMLFLNSCLCAKYSLDAYRYSSTEISNPINYFSHQNPIISHLHIFIKSMNICLSQLEAIKWKQ